MPPADRFLHHAFAGGAPLRVLVAGWCELGPWWGGWCRQPPLWRIYVQDRPGVAVELEDGRTVALGPGAAWLLPAGLSARNRLHGRTGHLWLHFDAAPLALDPPAAPCAVPLGADLAGLCDRLRSAAGGPPEAAPAVRCLAVALAGAVLGAWWMRLDGAARAACVRAPVDARLAPALARIESGLAYPLSNPGLARACGLDASTFVRRFRASTGRTPARFVRDRRIARAAELLAGGETDIAAVATATGFADRYSLSRAFTRRLGVPPAAYRDGHAAGQGMPPDGSSPRL